MNWPEYNRGYLSVFLKWGLAIYIVFNTFILVYFWMEMSNKPKMPFMPRGPQGNFAPNIAGELGFSKDQEEKFKLIEQENFRMMDSISKSSFNIRHQLADEVLKPNPDANLINKKAHEIGKITEEIEKQVANNLIKIKELCTPDQKEKLKTIFQKIGPKPGHNGPHGPNGSDGMNRPMKQNFPQAPPPGD